MKKLIDWITWNLEAEHLIVIGVAILFLGAIVYTCLTANPTYSTLADIAIQNQ